MLGFFNNSALEMMKNSRRDLCVVFLMPRNQLFFLRVEIDEFFFFWGGKVATDLFLQVRFWYSYCILRRILAITVSLVPYKFGEAIPAIPFPSLPNIF